MGSSQTSSYELDQHQLISCVKSSAPDAEFAKLELLRTHEPLIRSAIRAARIRGLLLTNDQLCDARQAAILGLLEALERYEMDRGFTFGAYARHYVYGAVHKALAGDAEYWRRAQALPTDEDCSENETKHKVHPALRVPPDTATENREISDLLDRFVKSLPPQQKYVVVQVFKNDRLQAEVADELGVSRMAVNGLLRRAIKRGGHSLGQAICN